MAGLKLILVNPQEDMCKEWHRHFSDPQVTIHCGHFQALGDYDVLAAPANSFGLMDGGMDEAIIKYFGDALMVRVHNHILRHYRGEQPIGTSFLVPTGHDRHRWLAHSPTMRVPCDVQGTDNAYRATFATLLAVESIFGVSCETIVVLPAFCAGTGHMDYREVARQMALAWTNFCNPPSEITWEFATRRNFEIETSEEMRDFLAAKPVVREII